MFSTDLIVEFPEFYQHGKDPDLFQEKNFLNAVIFLGGDSFDHSVPQARPGMKFVSVGEVVMSSLE